MEHLVSGSFIRKLTLVPVRRKQPGHTAEDHTPDHGNAKQYCSYVVSYVGKKNPGVKPGFFLGVYG
ncbi:MAG: hypothetical protein J7K46_04520 [Bacteroidales bacterium]|nr:hypothetical protein [Bacteroidales bacterium]